MEEGTGVEVVESPSTEAAVETPAIEQGSESPIADKSGAETPAQTKERTYREKEVSEIVSKRVNEWSQLGKPEELKAKLAEYERMKAAFAPKPEPTQPAEDPQAKQVREYMEKLYPELKSLGQFQAQYQAQAQAAVQAVTDRNLEVMGKLVEESGFSKEVLPFIDNAVADSIRSSKEDLAKYQETADPEIIKKHYNLVKTGFLSRLGAVKNAEYEAKKGSTKNLPPAFPKGGIPAPTSKQKKLTDSERQAAAHEMLSKG